MAKATGSGGRASAAASPTCAGPPEPDRDRDRGGRKLMREMGDLGRLRLVLEVHRWHRVPPGAGTGGARCRCRSALQPGPEHGCAPRGASVHAMRQEPTLAVPPAPRKALPPAQGGSRQGDWGLCPHTEWLKHPLRPPQTPAGASGSSGSALQPSAKRNFHLSTLPGRAQSLFDVRRAQESQLCPGASLGRAEK